MKIQPYSIQNQRYTTNQPVKKLSGDKQMSEDKVEISSKGKNELNGIGKIDPSRMKKLDQIKNQINNGTYEINNEDIAKDMINFYKNKINK